MIQAFPSYRSDDSLDVSALPWRPRSAENFFDTQHLDLFPKLVSVNPISIPKQVFWCAVEWKGFDDLLGGPRGRWVSLDVKVEIRKSALLASISLLLVRKSDFLVSISLLLVRKAICS